MQQRNQKTAASVAKLLQERDQARVAAQQAANQFARVKPGEVTDLYAQAMTLFVKGDAQQALLLLNVPRLEREFKDAEKAKDKDGTLSSTCLILAKE